MQSQLLKNSLNFIFPHLCIACGTKAENNKFLCNQCNRKLVYADHRIIEQSYNQLQNITSLFTLYKFEKDSPIQLLLHKLKYENKFRIAYHLGNIFADKYSDVLNKLHLDCIIPVPLFHSKRAERGYNQTYYFAKGISKATGIGIKVRILKRIRFTDTQTKLSKSERLKNIRGAFHVQKESSVKSKNILILDDVLTTGSTIVECAGMLKEAGAHNIYAGTIAIV